MKKGNNQPEIPRILILTPVHNEEQSLPIYENTVNEVLLNHPDYDFEVLLIDDGSTDQSWDIICRICNKNNHFRGVRLSRNYGSHMALSAGFAHADADAVAILACDLQDPPTVILKFLEKWRSGAQIVWGRRRTRGDEGWRLLWIELLNQLPKLMFFLLPVFALLLKLFYIRRKILYINHLIFALHIHTVIFLYLIVVNIIPTWYIILATVVGIWFHLFFAFRTVYQQSRWITFVKMNALFIFYYLILAIGFSLLVHYQK